MSHGKARSVETDQTPEEQPETEASQAAQEAAALSIEDLAVRLHKKLGETLLVQIECGEATSGVLAAAIKWLKDQNMVINMGSQCLPEQNSGPSLVEDLPYHDEVFKKVQ